MKKSEVKRAYKAGLQFDGGRAEEKVANAIIRRDQQIIYQKIINQNMVDHAYELLDERPDLSGTIGAAHLAKKVGDRSNIGQVSNLLALKSVKGALDREKKLEVLFQLFEEHPDEAICWMLFQRTPFLEKSLAYQLDVDFEYARNLVFAAGRRLHANTVQLLLPQLEQQEIIKALETLMAEVKCRIDDRIASNQSVTAIQGFYTKLQLLHDHREFLVFCLQQWVSFEQYATKRRHLEDVAHASRWKSLKTLSNLFIPMLGDSLGSKHSKDTTSSGKYHRIKHLFSAIRSVLVGALSTHLSGTVNKLCATINTRELIGKPFEDDTGNTDNERQLPLKLIMGSKYVVARPGKGKVLTRHALENGGFELIIKNPDKRGHKISAFLQISKRMLRMINRGAKITSLSLFAGDPPAHKISVVINMEGTRKAFQSLRFLGTYPDLDIPRIPQSTPVGVDINQIGPHLLVFSERIELPVILKKLSKLYLNLAKQISRLSRAHTHSGWIKHRGELNRLYHRRSNLLNEIRNQCKLLTTKVLIATGTDTLRVENLRVSARGTSGTLAKAILNMPDELDIFEQATFLAAAHTGVKVKLEPINPRQSSRIHHDCGGRLQRDKKNWHVAPCKNCGQIVDTHHNAAMNIAAGGITS